MRQWLAIFCLILGLLVGFSAGFVSGLPYGEQGARHLMYLSQRNRIQPVLAGDPAAYGDVTVREAPDGHAYLTGRIRSLDAHSRLLQELKRLFGEPIAETMLDDVRLGMPS
jgi:hypothetical protein